MNRYLSLTSGELAIRLYRVESEGAVWNSATDGRDHGPVELWQDGYYFRAYTCKDMKWRGWSCLYIEKEYLNKNPTVFAGDLAHHYGFYEGFDSLEGLEAKMTGWLSE